jgi:hypothetical protein
MRWALHRILAQGKSHPLFFLVDPVTNNWRARAHAEEHEPAVQAGHLSSFHSGAIERLALEDADYNQAKNWTIENRWRQGIVETTAVEIGGIPVERLTAAMWERLSLLPKGTLAAAHRHPGFHQ